MTAPIVSMTVGGQHPSLIQNHWSQVSHWLTYSDADGDPAVQYQFQDNGTDPSSAYLWTPAAGQEPASTTFTVNASDLNSVWFKGGAVAGQEFMQVRAFDGTAWGTWTTFQVDTFSDSAPAATINDQSLRANHWASVAIWLTYSDPEGDPAVQYQFLDGSNAANGTYFWTPGNPQQPANTAFTVNASDINSVWLKGGAVAGASETMQVRAFDGTSWGNWDSFTITTSASTTANSFPTVSMTVGAQHPTLIQNHWSQVSSWLTYADADGDPAVQYQFQDNDGSPTTAYLWTPGNSHEPAGTPFTVNASDLNSVWFRGGASPGQEFMQVRAFDGTDWGAWTTFQVDTFSDSAPVATINDHNLRANHWVSMATWLTYSDSDGDPAVQYQFEDGNGAASSAYFWTPDNSQEPANTVFTVNASDINSVWLRGAAAVGSSDTMSVRAFDGTTWGNWDSFTITAVGNTAPTVSMMVGAQHPTLIQNHWSQVSSWLTYTDTDGDPAVQYQFQDNDGGPTTAYLWTPGNAHEPASTPFTVDASDLNSVWFRGGAVAGQEFMQVRAFDGTDWGAWTTFQVDTFSNSAPVATINDHSLSANQWASVASWINYSDTEGDPAVQYQFQDNTAAGNSAYFWTPDNSHQPANAAFTVNAADLSNVWLRGGAAAGTDTMQVRAFDGTSWGAWDTFTLTTTA